MKKQILIVPSIILVLLIALILWSNWNNIFFKSVDSHKVSVAVIKCRKVAVKKCMFMAVRNDI